MARNYKFEYLRDQASPQQIKARSERNQARAAVEKKLGKKLPTTQEVDHKQAISKGGTNAAGNLRVISRHANRVKAKGG